MGKTPRDSKKVDQTIWFQGGKNQEKIMFNKKRKLTNLSKEDLAELIKRKELVNQYLLVIQGLNLQNTLWLNECFKKLGLDPRLLYDVDFKNGAVTETKEEEKIDEPKGDKKNS